MPAAGKRRVCSKNPAISLTTKRVTCKKARSVANRAIKASDCPPAGGAGCQQTVDVGAWRCRGLYPGEGWNFRCRSGKRRIYYSGGG